MRFNIEVEMDDAHLIPSNIMPAIASFGNSVDAYSGCIQPQFKLEDSGSGASVMMNLDKTMLETIMAWCLDTLLALEKDDC